MFLKCVLYISVLGWFCLTLISVASFMKMEDGNTKKSLWERQGEIWGVLRRLEAWDLGQHTVTSETTDVLTNISERLLMLMGV